MLFANGYRYHMRNIGCPMSLDGYGVASGHLGTGRHSLVGCLYSNQRNLSWPQRSAIVRNNNRRNRQRHRLVSTNTNRNSSLNENCNLVCYHFNCWNLLKRFCYKNRNGDNYNSTGLNDNNSPLTTYTSVSINPQTVLTRKCVVSMTTTHLVLLFLGLVSTIVGGIYFQRNNSYNFRNKMYQMICIVAIISGIIMLLISGVICRIFFCKSKCLTIDTASSQNPQNVTNTINTNLSGIDATNENSTDITVAQSGRELNNNESDTGLSNEGRTNQGLTYRDSGHEGAALSNGMLSPSSTDRPTPHPIEATSEDTSRSTLLSPLSIEHNSLHHQHQLLLLEQWHHNRMFQNDAPPTYSQCGGSPLIDNSFYGLDSTNVVSSANVDIVSYTSISVSPSSSPSPSLLSLDIGSAPPKYSTDPPPRYSQLDVRNLLALQTTGSSLSSPMTTTTATTPTSSDLLVDNSESVYYHHHRHHHRNHHQPESPCPVSWQQGTIISPSNADQLADSSSMMVIVTLPIGHDAINNTRNQVRSNDILYVENYKTC